MRVLSAEQRIPSDKALARSAGVGDFVIHNLSKNGRKSFPYADNAVRIARVLGTTVEYLVTGEHPPERQLRPELAVICRRLRDLPRDQLIRIDGMIEGYLQTIAEVPARALRGPSSERAPQRATTTTIIRFPRR